MRRHKGHPQSCTDSQTECNGNCLDLNNPDAAGCHVVGAASVATRLALGQGYVYFTDYNGVSRVNVSTGAENLLTAHQSMLVAVSGDTTYFTGGSGDSAGVFSVPSTGGAETKMASSSAATFLAVVSGCLVFDVFDYGNIGINSISLTNGTATQLVGTLVTAYCDGTSVYYIDSSALYSINPAAPLTVTTLGSWTSGTVLAMSFAMFNGVPYLNSYDRIVSTNLTDSTTSPVWRSGMAGDYYTGTIRGPFSFPSARGLFFIFDTAPLAHVMFLPTDGTPVRRLGSFNPQCAAALVADASNVYVGTCRHIVSLTY